MKILIALFTVLSSAAYSYPELCMPDHQQEYTQAYGEAKTSIDQLWHSSALSCNEVGEFLDYFELKEPLPETATEKEKCVWAGSAQGVALFSHQREQECGAKKCVRIGNYIGRNVAKAFCATVELYTSDLTTKFMADLERPVCALGEAECVNEAEIYAGIKCDGLKKKHAAIWTAILNQTCR